MTTTPLQSDFHRDGFAFPLEAMSSSEALDIRTELEAIERDYGADPNYLYAINGGLEFILPFIDAITRRAQILDCVEELLGPDLIVFSTASWTKEPNTSHYVSWHQDLTYWGMDGVDEVTAWVALSPVTVENGCMRMLPQSHNRELAPHKDTFATSNLLSRGQEIAEPIDDRDAVNIELEPGQFSLHHGRTFHASHANHSDDRRVGISINYIATSMHNRDGIKPLAHLVRGGDKFGHFQLIPPPKGVLHADDVRNLRESKALADAFIYESTDRRLESHSRGALAGN
jgi:non-heme Fe2+,alpha-ketoglutarate-dependent halogenase